MVRVNAADINREYTVRTQQEAVQHTTNKTAQKAYEGSTKNNQTGGVDVFELGRNLVNQNGGYAGDGKYQLLQQGVVDYLSQYAGDDNVMSDEEYNAWIKDLEKGDGYSDDTRVIDNADGTKTVVVERWDGKKSTNGCLWDIVENSYDFEGLGLEKNSANISALVNAIATTNDDIDDPWSYVIHPGDVITLPDVYDVFDNLEKPALNIDNFDTSFAEIPQSSDPAAPAAEPTTPSGTITDVQPEVEGNREESHYDLTGETVVTIKDDKGNILQHTTKDADGNVTYQSNHTYGENGVLTDDTISYNEDGSKRATHVDYIYDESGKVSSKQETVCVTKPDGTTEMSYSLAEAIPNKNGAFISHKTGPDFVVTESTAPSEPSSVDPSGPVPTELDPQYTEEMPLEDIPADVINALTYKDPQTDEMTAGNVNTIQEYINTLDPIETMQFLNAVMNYSPEEEGVYPYEENMVGFLIGGYENCTNDKMMEIIGSDLEELQGDAQASMSYLEQWEILCADACIPRSMEDEGLSFMQTIAKYDTDFKVLDSIASLYSNTDNIPFLENNGYSIEEVAKVYQAQYDGSSSVLRQVNAKFFNALANSNGYMNPDVLGLSNNQKTLLNNIIVNECDSDPNKILDSDLSDRKKLYCLAQISSNPEELFGLVDDAHMNAILSLYDHKVDTTPQSDPEDTAGAPDTSGLELTGAALEAYNEILYHESYMNEDGENYHWDDSEVAELDNMLSSETSGDQLTESASIDQRFKLYEAVEKINPDLSKRLFAEFVKDNTDNYSIDNTFTTITNDEAFSNLDGPRKMEILDQFLKYGDYDLDKFLDDDDYRAEVVHLISDCDPGTFPRGNTFLTPEYVAQQIYENDDNEQATQQLQKLAEVLYAGNEDFTYNENDENNFSAEDFINPATKEPSILQMLDRHYVSEHNGWNDFGDKQLREVLLEAFGDTNGIISAFMKTNNPSYLSTIIKVLNCECE